MAKEAIGQSVIYKSIWLLKHFISIKIAILFWQNHHLLLNDHDIYYTLPNGFLGHNYVYLDINILSLVHIVPKIKAFGESVSHF